MVSEVSILHSMRNVNVVIFLFWNQTPKKKRRWQLPVTILQSRDNYFSVLPGLQNFTHAEVKLFLQYLGNDEHV